MKRRIYASILVDDEAAFRETGDGPITYLEKEMERCGEDQIFLENAFIADDDDDDWQGYLNYLAQWAFSHRDDGYEGNSPLTFEQYRVQ